MHEGCFLQTRLSNTFNVFLDQKTQPSIRFKTCGWAFETLRRAFKTLDRAFETLDRAFEDLRETKSSPECLRSLVAGLCYNTAHAVPISHGKSRYKWRVLGYKTAALLLSVKFKWFIFWFKMSDTSATRTTRVRHEWKILTLITTRVKTYFHALIVTIWQVKDYKERNNFILRCTF